MTAAKRQKIAVIGSGISGLSAAWLLAPHHDVTLYEKDDYLGGHSHTARVNYNGREIDVDTGFIVFNNKTYPHLKALFRELGVQTQPSDMSFGVSVNRGWLEFSSITISKLFMTPRHLFNPKFIQMLLQIVRFNKNAEKLMQKAEQERWTLKELLEELDMGDWFRRYYLLPMAGAIWSCSPKQMLEYPAVSFLRFFGNHGLLTVRDHPQWFTMVGGAQAYVREMRKRFDAGVRLNTPVREVRHEGDKKVVITASGERESFDAVVFAVHGNLLHAMLPEASPEEKEIYSAFHYTTNRAVLHCDESLMPRRKEGWASWNYLSEENGDEAKISVTYWMNRLQSIDSDCPLYISLNPWKEPDPEKIFGDYVYHHPAFGHETLEAQQKIKALQGKNGLWYCGAYHRYGFHEDGLLSALDVVNRMGIQAPWQ